MVIMPFMLYPLLKKHNFLEIVLHLLKLVLLGLKTMTYPRLELTGYEQRLIAA